MVALVGFRGRSDSHHHHMFGKMHTAVHRGCSNFSVLQFPSSAFSVSSLVSIWREASCSWAGCLWQASFIVTAALPQVLNCSVAKGSTILTVSSTHPWYPWSQARGDPGSLQEMGSPSLQSLLWGIWHYYYFFYCWLLLMVTVFIWWRTYVTKFCSKSGNFWTCHHPSSQRRRILC